MFHEHQLHDRLMKALHALNFNTPTNVQLATLADALAGEDVLVTAETGSGKTAAFLIPLLDRLLTVKPPGHEARALILTPTRELAQQVNKHLELLAQFTFIKGDTVCGGEEFKPQAARLRKNPDILIATPGRLIDHLDKGTIDLSDIEVLILDEADRMVDMGFEDDVKRIIDTCPTERQTMLFSATLSKNEIPKFAIDCLDNPKIHELNSHREVHHKITHQIITATDSNLKDKQLISLLHKEKYEKVIVFTNTIVEASRLNGYVRRFGLRAGILHGDLTQEQRKHVVNLLQSGKLSILIATDVAARGIDIKGIELVINRDMPRSGDDYIHRTGRTGRAGLAGKAISLIDPTEWNLMASIERYLKTKFEKRQIQGLEGSYTGPKKLKSSGKATGSKKKKTAKKQLSKPAQKAAKAKKSKPKTKQSSKPSMIDDGMAPLTRKR
ncbi:MAG: ATP-dependent DEAD/DEAH box helicase [Osedax symbiont Rs1]|nr:MAG: ATP-dependent DEAD/DEAH box helicase [Osedax symbiont Rs1]